MKTTYQITNSELFNAIVSDIEIENLTRELNIEIELKTGRKIEIQGEFAPNDFEADYGFILVNE